MSGENAPTAWLLAGMLLLTCGNVCSRAQAPQTLGEATARVNRMLRSDDATEVAWGGRGVGDASGPMVENGSAETVGPDGFPPLAGYQFVLAGPGATIISTGPQAVY
jgi:hypothetical protein